jgi:hypothetical protein
LKTWGSPEATKTLSRSAYPWKYKPKFGRKWESGENFLQQQLSIYRGKGGISRTRLDPTVARFPEDACPLWRFEGDVFLLNFKVFGRIGSSKSTRFPEGLVLGNSGKNLSPSERRVWRNSWNKFSGTLNLWRSGILNLRSPEVANLQKSGILNLRSPEVANLRRSGIFNLRSPKVAIPRRSESWTCEALKSRTCEDLEPESAKFENLLKIKFGGYGVWRFLWIKNSWTG